MSSVGQLSKCLVHGGDGWRRRLKWLPKLEFPEPSTTTGRSTSTKMKWLGMSRQFDIGHDPFRHVPPFTVVAASPSFFFGFMITLFWSRFGPWTDNKTGSQQQQKGPNRLWVDASDPLEGGGWSSAGRMLIATLSGRPWSVGHSLLFGM